MVITLRGGGMGVRLEKQTTNNFRPGVLISLLSLDIVYSTYRKNILRVFKNVTFRFNTDANQLRLSCGFIFFTSSTLWEFISARIMSSNF